MRDRIRVPIDPWIALSSAVAIMFLFLLGIGNFTMHKAVMESGHPLLGQLPRFVHLLGGRFGLIVEYLLLAGAMLMVQNAATSQGGGGAMLAYIGYTAANGLGAWLIVTRRI